MRAVSEAGDALLGDVWDRRTDLFRPCHRGMGQVGVFARSWSWCWRAVVVCVSELRVRGTWFLCKSLCVHTVAAVLVECPRVECRASARPSAQCGAGSGSGQCGLVLLLL